MNNGTITVLAGAEGIKEAYERSLKAKKLAIVCLSGNYEQVLDGFFDRDYAPKLYDGSHVTQEILPDIEGNREDAKKKSKNHDVRFLKLDRSSESDMVLSEDTALFISYAENHPFALVITEKELVASLHMQFEALWKTLV